MIPNPLKSLTTAIFLSILAFSRVFSALEVNSSLTYLWPLPSEFTSGNETLSVDPGLSLSLVVSGGRQAAIVTGAFDRYKKIIFSHANAGVSPFTVLRGRSPVYDVRSLRIVVDSDNDDLQLGVDESYTLFLAKKDGQSIVGEATIEANTVYGALRGLETFSQLCSFDYESKSVLVYQAPWYIQDKPRFAYRGLLIDTSRHYLPVSVIKQIVDSMSYAKLNVLHWHVIDEQSFPLEVPTYPKLWRGAYTKSERYTVEDAIEIVNYAKLRGINVMAEVDVPGHAESWGAGYPDLWPSSTCREPLDVSKNFTFDVVSGILADMREIFPFELFHLGGDENQRGQRIYEFSAPKDFSFHADSDALNIAFRNPLIGCWSSTPHVKQWLQDKNITTKDAYQYFVLRAQEIAISKNWTPVNWEETFNTFPEKLHPRTVVHNWLGSGICPKVVAKGFRCIFSNQGVWYLDHLDVPWNDFYTAEPLEGIDDASKQKLVLGGEVCMWGETADTSNVQQTIWPRAAAAAERLWSSREAISSGNINTTALPRLHYFRCLLNRRGVQAAPVTNKYARTPPTGPGSCFEQ